MIIQLHPQNPEIRILKTISNNLKNGAVYIFPTDTVYALITDANSKKGIEKIFSLKEMDKWKPFSIFCKDISNASEYVESLPNEAFRLMKKITPGPFTFIFKANKNLPRYSIVNEKSRTIGIRIPDQIYITELLKIHEGLISSTSVFRKDEFITNLESLEEIYGSEIDGIVDGGNLKTELSTILNFTSGELVIEREGKGMEQIE
jgi:tRNA threonylcarbamoyl adenosine modification protein (Sua5/YciO/YrdC/YwlC family)